MVADGAGDTTEDGDEVGVAPAVGLAFRDGCGELIVGLGLAGVTVGAELVGATVAGVVVPVPDEEELAAFGAGLTQR
jgi:hypothetical protein